MNNHPKRLFSGYRTIFRLEKNFEFKKKFDGGLKTYNILTFERHLSRESGMKKQTNANFAVATSKFYGQMLSSSASAVPDSYWNVNNRQFNVDRNNADNRNSNNGMRGGMRILCVIR